MSQPIKVVHFLNQFFAGVGGEEQANLPVEVRDGAVGPGRALQAQLGNSGQVVATIVSGDNYFTEESAASARAVLDALSKFQPDVVVAGPAFNAGRYGLACGEVCVLANAEGIPAVTGMYPENPGVLEYDTRAYIVPTDESPVRMQEIVANWRDSPQNSGPATGSARPKKRGICRGASDSPAFGRTRRQSVPWTCCWPGWADATGPPNCRFACRTRSCLPIR